MKNSLQKILQGYNEFRKKYASGDNSVMQLLASHGQRPEIMIIACSDARVDPALILQCNPGDLFVVRNVANIVPPYEQDSGYHGTSAALEFGICYLHVKHLILFGHSQCGGIEALIQGENQLQQDDFISHWVSLIRSNTKSKSLTEVAKDALSISHQNCMTFPWICERVEQEKLKIHRWFFDIKKGEILRYTDEDQGYVPLSAG